ncbi:MAG: 2OG-Fe(II) oxygenase [Acidimicrobiales bacterium]
MRGSPRHRLATLLGELTAEGSFSASCRAPVDDLAIKVDGVGLLKLPVSASQAIELRRIARPARYGRGEDTVLDRRVRDTWEVARSRVRIDRRRWNRTLLPALDTLRRDLGLPDSCQLRAELHSMLVYEAHQFFAPHQDAEKADDMVGTLVVILPSNATGGELIVRHRGTESTYRSSRTLLTFVALYADTVHEVKPLGSGYRVVLTYNLLLTGDSTVTTTAAVPAQ